MKHHNGEKPSMEFDKKAKEIADNIKHGLSDDDIRDLIDLKTNGDLDTVQLDIMFDMVKRRLRSRKVA
jgi:hypothetical protein